MIILKTSYECDLRNLRGEGILCTHGDAKKIDQDLSVDKDDDELQSMCTGDH